MRLFLETYSKRRKAIADIQERAEIKLTVTATLTSIASDKKWLGRVLKMNTFDSIRMRI